MSAADSLLSHLAPDRILVDIDVDSKPALLDALVERAASAAAVVDPDRLRADVYAREARMSTGVGQGLALPHARTAAVTDTVLAVATLVVPVDYEALDGSPVQIAVLLAGPDGDPSAHIRLLSRISRLISRPAFRTDLLDATTPDDVMRVFADAEAALA
jgi:mannitol/fructose-specific phosphotransferase system IIA component (Ntr-type)